MQSRPDDSSGLFSFWDTMLVFSASPPSVFFFFFGNLSEKNLNTFSIFPPPHQGTPSLLKMDGLDLERESLLLVVL